MRKHRGEERRGGAYQAGREFLADVGIPVNYLGWKGDAGYVGYVYKEKSVLTD